MRRFVLTSLAIPALLGFAPERASAGSTAKASYPATAPLGGALTDTDFVTAPHAFQNFCLAHANQCVSHGHASRVNLDSARLAELEDVNRRVNQDIRPLPAAPAGDAYRLGVSAGSCNEYAVEKRRRLLARGWSAAALSLAVVLLPDSRGHLVLTARTNRGDLVLDNLSESLMAANQTRYVWLKRQSTIHPMLWVRIGAGSASRATEIANAGDI
jgi:predicted transglutaminase-like cysteine proteinase